MIENYYSEENIKRHYFNSIKTKSNTVGVDKISRRIFENKLPMHIKTINLKILSGNYKFSPYRGIVIPKTPNKYPRTISIATMRDRLVLSILNKCLQNQFTVRQELVHTKISSLKESLEKGTYNTYIKIDIKEFYPSINHNKLEEMLNISIDNKIVLKLIEKAITQKTYFEGYTDDIYKTERRGVPQGLPISNILAEIYLLEFDRKHEANENYEIFRYVDDIFILCNHNNSDEIFFSIKEELTNEYKLCIHDLGSSKTYKGKIEDGFDFLGYKYDNNLFTVRKATINRLERSIEKIFSKHSKKAFKNIELFLWELNIRITGLIVEKKVGMDNESVKKKYGWLFFFSQIDDEAILYHLDFVVNKLIDRYNIRKKIDGEKLKRFVRTYNEIKYNRSSTKYIPNFSTYSLEEKRELLITVFKREEAKKFSEVEIENKFYGIIYRTTRDLEEDVQYLS